MLNINFISNLLVVLSSLALVCIGFSLTVTTENADISMVALVILGAYQLTVSFSYFFKKIAVKSWTCIKYSLSVIAFAEVALAISLYFRINSIIAGAGQYYSSELAQQIDFENSIRNSVKNAIYCGLAVAAVQFLSTGILIASHTKEVKTKGEFAKRLLVETTTDYESHPAGTTSEENSPDGRGYVKL